MRSYMDHAEYYSLNLALDLRCRLKSIHRDQKQAPEASSL